MKITLVEDNSEDATWIRAGVVTAFHATVEIIDCEKDFVDRLPALGQHPPDLIIFDVMLRWAHASEELERDVEEGRVPPEVMADGAFLRAGFRCVERLKARPDTAKIPYLIYTGLRENNFEETVIHLESKIITKSEDIEPLISAVRAKLGRKVG